MKEDTTCYLERSEVRVILISHGDADLLRKVDALPISTAEDMRGNAQAVQEPVAYVPRSKAPGSEGEPIWREAFAAKWLEKGTWRGFDLMPLYTSPASATQPPINETSRDWDVCRAVDLYRAPRNEGDERTLSDFLEEQGLRVSPVSSTHQPAPAPHAEVREALSQEDLAGLLANAMFSENLNEMPVERDEFGPSWCQDDMRDAAKEIQSAGYIVTKAALPQSERGEVG